jgi:hypothetical protein
MSTRLALALVSTVVGTLLLTPVRSVSSQSSSGAISGRITDTAGVSLYAANVRIVGTPFNAATEQSGAFRFAGVPDGSYWVRVTALGYTPESSQVTVDGNRTASVAARLHPAAVLLSPVAINAQRMGETKRAALNHQQAAANIVTVLSGPDHHHDRDRARRRRAARTVSIRRRRNVAVCRHRRLGRCDVPVA